MSIITTYSVSVTIEARVSAESPTDAISALAAQLREAAAAVARCAGPDEPAVRDLTVTEVHARRQA